MRKLFNIAVLLLLANIGRAQGLLRLNDVEAAIRQHHPALQMEDARARASEAAAQGAYSWAPPELGAGLFMTPYDPGRWKYKNGQPGRGSVMLSVQQMFPNKKQQEANYQYLQAQSTVDRQNKEVMVNNLLYAARQNYYDLIILQKKLNVLNESEKLLKFMLQSAEIRYQNGLGKISVYYKVKAALAQIENSRMQWQNEMAQKQIAINTIMNRNVLENFEVDTQVHWVAFPTAMTDTGFLFQNRSDLKLLNLQMEVNRLDQKAELAALKPQFGIKYDHMMGWARQPWQFSLMAMVRLPIGNWSTRMNRAKAESLSWQNEALRHQQQAVVNQALGTMAESVNNLELKKNQMRLYQEQVIPALRRNFQTMQLGFEQNTEELFPLFDAWEALNMAQLQYFDLVKEALMSQAELQNILEIK